MSASGPSGPLVAMSDNNYWVVIAMADYNYWVIIAMSDYKD